MYSLLIQIVIDISKDRDMIKPDILAALAVAALAVAALAVAALAEKKRDGYSAVPLS